MLLNRPTLKKSLAGYFLLAILCLPLFFINVRDSHDWGDDFAAYIHESANIVNGVPQSETGFLYNEDYSDISIIPDIGFPLLLSPVYYFWGNDIKAFLLFISLALYLLSFALMYFFSRHFSTLISVFLVLIIIYNPWTLSFKAEILSDIPFALFLMLSVNFYLAKGIDKTINCVILGIMIGYLISIRTVGLALPLALSCLFIKTLIQTPDKNDKINLTKNNLIIAAASIGIYFLLNKFLFAIPSQGSYIDPGQMHPTNLISVFLINLKAYFSFIPSYFRSLGRYEFLSTGARALAVVSLFTGLIYKYKGKTDLLDFLVAIYLFAIMILASSRERYLFPMLPFLAYYMAFGLQNSKLKININKNIIASALGIFILIQYYPEVKWIIKHQNEIQNGPQETASVETFDYIKKNTPKNSVIVFVKPRALALYTGRKGMGIEPTDDLQKLKDKFERKGVNYLLVHTEETKEPTLAKYIEEYKGNVDLVWNNEKFFLYKII